MYYTWYWPHLKPLHGFLLRKANIGLVQGDRPEAVIEEEESLGGVDPEEGRHILVVGQGGRDTDQLHQLLGGLDLMDGSGHNGLQDWTPVIVEEVNLVLRKHRDRDAYTWHLHWHPSSSRTMYMPSFLASTALHVHCVPFCIPWV